MLNCKEVTEMCSQEMERDLRLQERMSLRMHLMMCSGCSNFRQPDAHDAQCHAALCERRRGLDLRRARRRPMRHVLTRLWSRRSTLALGTLAGFFASGGLRVIAAQGDSFALVRAEGIQRIDAGGPTGLLGLDASGALWALSVSGGAPLRMAGSLDGQTPVAAAEGRIAARTPRRRAVGA